MNSLLDRLSIGAAVLIAAAAIADVGPLVRIVPMADGLEIVLDLGFGARAPGYLAGLIEAVPAAHCAIERSGGTS